MKHSVQSANTYVQAHLSDVNPSFRPSYHIAVPVGWLNDPNGCCFDGNHYHVFCQYHPYEAVWGPMHWGHYISTDLLHWQWQGVVMAPDAAFDDSGCFSGTALALENGLAILYTGVSQKQDETVQAQCLAHYQNGTVKKYPKNPVLTAPEGYSERDFRDPYLYRDGDRYAMLVTANHAQGGEIRKYLSDDLIRWNSGTTVLEGLDAIPECPSCCEIDGKQVLIFCMLNRITDPDAYHAQSPVCCCVNNGRGYGPLCVTDGGLDFYAPQVFRALDGRQLLIGWMYDHHNDSPAHYLGHGWNGMMTLIRELYLDGDQLIQRPAREYASCLNTILEMQDTEICEKPVTLSQGKQALRFTLALRTDSRQWISIRLFEKGDEYLLITYHGHTQTLTVDRSHCGYRMGSQGTPEARPIASVRVPPESGLLSLDIWQDRCSVEIFVQQGRYVMSSLAYTRNTDFRATIACNSPCTAEMLRVSEVCL